MNRPLFFLRAFNDIDHLTPLISKFSEMGDEVHVILYSEFMDYNSDYRIKYLKTKPNILFHYKIDKTFSLISGLKKLSFTEKVQKKIIQKKRSSGIIAKLLNKYNRNDCNEEAEFLIDNEITHCIFEWGTPGSRGESQRDLFAAAKGLGLPTFSLPHGCNIYLSSCVTDHHVKLARRGKYSSLKAYSEYDYLIFQNKERRDQFVSLGAHPLKTQVWGSLRFCPEWQIQNLSLCPDFKSQNSSEGKLKLVFMHHQFKYRIKDKLVWELLQYLVEQGWIYLVIKDSTREGLTVKSDEFYKKIENYKNVERVGNNIHSPSLIRWADSVINFGSSIALEVLLQKKQLITTSYLHENKTLFERYPEASTLANNHDEVLVALKDTYENTENKEFIIENNKVIEEVVYGGKEKHDVIQFYYDSITSNKLNY